jgi:hypothetical protein
LEHARGDGKCDSLEQRSALRTGAHRHRPGVLSAVCCLLSAVCCLLSAVLSVQRSALRRGSHRYRPGAARAEERHAWCG